MKNIQSIALFCGSSAGNNPLYAQLAREFGKRCAQLGLTLYYGGGCIGLMGEAANAAMAYGGKVIGVAPDFFKKGPVLSENITQMIYVKTMGERKQLMETNADAFVGFPGGYGTMDEIFEIATDAQLGMHNKPVAIFNPNGFFDLLIEQLKHFRDEGFLRPMHHDIIITATELDELFSKLDNYSSSNDHSWFEKINR